MEPMLTEILKFGTGGLIGAVFFWLYLQERKDHAATRSALIDSMSARIDDSKASVAKVTDALSGLTMGVQAISNKIHVSKAGQ